MSQTPHGSPSTPITQWSHLQTQGPREAPQAVLLFWSSVLALCSAGWLQDAWSEVQGRTHVHSPWSQDFPPVGSVSERMLWALPEPAAPLLAVYLKADHPHTSLFQLSHGLTHTKFFAPFLYLAKKGLGKSDLGETLTLEINSSGGSFRLKPLQIPAI